MLLLDNARVSISTGATPRLVNVRANIGVPSQRIALPYGGFVKYIVLIDPLAQVADCAGGDVLYILSWGANAVDPTRAHPIFESVPSGFSGLEVQRLTISDRQMG